METGRRTCHTEGMKYYVEMLRFPNNKPVVPIKRLFGESWTLEDAVSKGKQEISISSLQLDPIGFRVLDEAGNQVYIWQLGQDDV